jgi:hypothetical protein
MNTLEVCAQYLGCKKFDQHSLTPITLHKTTRLKKKRCACYILGFTYMISRFKKWRRSLVQKDVNI